MSGVWVECRSQTALSLTDSSRQTSLAQTEPINKVVRAAESHNSAGLQQYCTGVVYYYTQPSCCASTDRRRSNLWRGIQAEGRPARINIHLLIVVKLYKNFILHLTSSLQNCFNLSSEAQAESFIYIHLLPLQVTFCLLVAYWRKSTFHPREYFEKVDLQCKNGLFSLFKLFKKKEMWTIAWGGHKETPTVLAHLSTPRLLIQFRVWLIFSFSSFVFENIRKSWRYSFDGEKEKK